MRLRREIWDVKNSDWHSLIQGKQNRSVFVEYKFTEKMKRNSRIMKISIKDILVFGESLLKMENRILFKIILHGNINCSNEI